MMPLKEIDEAAYFAFAEAKFKSHGQRLAAETFHEAYTMVRGHTWYVQWCSTGSMRATTN